MYEKNLRYELVEFGIEPSRIKVVNLGVDNKFRFIQPYGKREDVIDYIGSFNPRKGVERLLYDWRENFDKLKKFKLILHGWGDSQFNYLFNKFNNKFNIFFGNFT